MPTYGQHVDAVLATFNTAGRVAYSIDALPDVLPPHYIEVSLTRRVGGVQVVGGDRNGRLLRVVARAVSKTLANAYAMWDLIDAIEGQRFMVAGIPTTPAEFDTDADVILPDQGWYSGARSITYALI